MSFPKRPSTLSRGLAHPFLVAALVVGSVVGFAAPAYAHHPIVSGTVECKANQQVITWTVANGNWSGRTMTLKQVLLSKGTISGIAVDQTYAPDQSRTGTTVLPGTDSGKVTLTVTGKWPTVEANTQSAEVTLVSGCTPPAVPHATINLSCADGGVKAVLTNTGGQPATFTIKKGLNQVGPTESVGANGSVTKIYAMAEDETAVFTVSATGMTTVTESVTRNCQNPFAVIDSNCTDGAIVTLTNSGGQQSVTFTITKGTTTLDTVTIAGGGPAVTKKYAMTEDETPAEFAVTAPGMTKALLTVSHNCQNPVVAISETCEQGAVVTFSNIGGQQAVIFTITKTPGTLTPGTVTVAPGATETRTYAMTENEVATYAVTAPGMTHLAHHTKQLTHDCQMPSAVISHSCPAGGATVVLTNDGLTPVEFTILRGTVEIEKVLVTKGLPRTRTRADKPLYGVAEDETATFTVNAPDLSAVTSTFTQDCQIPSVTSLTHTCAEGVKMVFANAGDLPMDFTVTKGGQPIAVNGTVNVPAKGSAERIYTLAENETATFGVSALGLTPVSVTFTRDCQNPLTAIDLTCADGVVVTLTNLGGQLPVNFTVVVNGTSSTVPVPANGTVTKEYPLAEDATAVVTVSAPNTPDTTATLTRDCQIPAATLAQSCVLGGVLATLSNAGTEPITFTLTKNGVAAGTVIVDGGKSETRTYTLAEDEKATFVASAPGMTAVTLDANQDCQIPSVTIAGGCAIGGVEVNFINAGQSPVAFTVGKGGQTVDSVTVAGGDRTVRLYKLAEDETGTFSLAAPGITTVNAAFTKDCLGPEPGVTTAGPINTEVLGIQVTQPPAVLPAVAVLPRTGGRPGGLGLFAATLAVLGIALRRMTRRPDSAA